MSQSEQDEIIGKAIRERGETKGKLAVLKAKAADMGNKLGRISILLNTNPGNLAFSNASTGENTSHDATWMNVTDYPQFQEISTICNEIREVQAKLRQLEIRAKELGL